MSGPWLKEGVTMLTRGKETPPGSIAGNCGVSCVHGQPVLPTGPRTSSSIVGQRIDILLQS
jgi:hypothetical protein